jgi:hypothetical protein
LGTASEAGSVIRLFLFAGGGGPAQFLAREVEHESGLAAEGGLQGLLADGAGNLGVEILLGDVTGLEDEAEILVDDDAALGGAVTRDDGDAADTDAEVPDEERLRRGSRLRGGGRGSRGATGRPL